MPLGTETASEELSGRRDPHQFEPEELNSEQSIVAIRVP